MVEVVDEAVADAEEFVEALFHGAVVAMGAEMPFSEERGAVAGGLQRLGQGDLFEGHVTAGLALHVSLHPGVDP